LKNTRSDYNGDLAKTRTVSPEKLKLVRAGFIEGTEVEFFGLKDQPEVSIIIALCVFVSFFCQKRELRYVLFYVQKHESSIFFIFIAHKKPRNGSRSTKVLFILFL
jgi:hypothetical protein